MHLNKLFNGKNKKKGLAGFSLPSVIVGSIIASVLGTIVVSSMWGSVDKSKIAAEKASIAETKVSLNGLLEDIGGFPAELSAVEDGFLESRLGNLPPDLKYQAILMDGADSGTTADDFIVIKAYADSTNGKTLLTTVAGELSAAYEGSDLGSDVAGASGRFTYNTTCSDETNAATSQTDCYYAVYGLAKSIKPGTLSGASFIDGGLVALDAATAAGNPDAITELN